MDVFDFAIGLDFVAIFSLVVAYYFIGFILIDLIYYDCDSIVLYSTFWIIIVPMRVIYELYKLIRNLTTTNRTNSYDDTYNGWH